ncbi:ThiF family adenylyltransferase [Kushneria phyllosphaerae]|uniref:Sulfur carrier protein ThiS adenylyltransferase n=1 Tax=Kushneria phyllosphaerae TaxID=2100822 RepID=A0A2R8CJ05_9GAMM|nr:ThiF family adenylyltransferase [Kushneria phyllosphaerae]SPJ32792.1 Sulfur carrier protein ThiS adenylyltransferase [Kushneria phyllosphaerae]
MHYKLAPDWNITLENNDLVFFNELDKKKIKNYHNASNTLAVIKKNVFNPNCLERELSSYLIQHDIIKPHYPNNAPPEKETKQAAFWDVFCNNPNKCVQMLKNKEVAIFGVGGIGSIVLEILASVGIKKFKLIDPDVVEASNFNRQYVYNHKDIGKPKVIAASENMLLRHNDLKFKTYISKYPCEEFGSIVCSSDFVVSAIDNPSLRSAIFLSQDSWELGIPSAFAATGIRKGFISPIFDPKKSSYSPFESSNIDLNSQHKSTPTTASSGSNNSIISSMFAEQIMFHLAEIKEEINSDHYLYLTRKAGKLSVHYRKNIVL